MEGIEDVSPAFIIGLDLGMLSDHSALAILRTTDESPPRLYEVPHLHRWELMTGYEAVVHDVVALFQTPQLSPRHDRTVVVDAGGVGRPVMELLIRHLDPIGVDVIGVTITGGFDVVRSAMNDYKVPKRDIAGALQSALGGRRIRVAKALKYADQLQHELKMMTLKFTKAGNEQFEALSERDHDDIVMALGMALWYADTELHSINTGNYYRTSEREARRYDDFSLIGGPTIHDV